MSDSWRLVSREHPCPQCQKIDWCTVGARWVHCMRIESPKPCKGGGWLHRLSDDRPHAPLPPSPPRQSDKELDAHWAEVALNAFISGQSKLPELANTLGVGVWALRWLQAGFAEINGSWCWTFPERNDEGLVLGIARRLITPNKAGKTKLRAKGSRAGLTYCDGGQMMRGPIYLPEGASDVAACLTLGLCAVGRPSNIGGLDLLASLLARHPQRQVIVLGENDRKPALYVSQLNPPHEPKCRCCMRCYPGGYGARYTAMALGKRLHRPVTVKLPPQGFKDFREYLRSLNLDLTNQDACFAAGEGWR